MLEFNDFVLRASVIDTGFSSNKFTLCKREHGLDKNGLGWTDFLSTLNGGSMSQIQVHHLPSINSVHVPLLLSLKKLMLHMAQDPLDI